MHGGGVFSKLNSNSYNHPVLVRIRESLLSDDSNIEEECRYCPHRSGSFASRV